MHYLIVPSVAIAIIFFVIMTILFWSNLRKVDPKPIRYSFLLSGVVLLLTYLEFLGASLFVYYFSALLVPGVAIAIISFVTLMILFCCKLRKPYLKFIPIYGFLLSGVVLLFAYLASLGLSLLFIIPGAVLAVISFAIQIIFCFKCRKLVLKLIPVYSFLLSGVLVLLTYMGFFGEWW